MFTCTFGMTDTVRMTRGTTVNAGLLGLSLKYVTMSQSQVANNHIYGWDDGGCDCRSDIKGN